MPLPSNSHSDARPPALDVTCKPSLRFPPSLSHFDLGPLILLLLRLRPKFFCVGQSVARAAVWPEIWAARVTSSLYIRRLRRRRRSGLELECVARVRPRRPTLPRPAAVADPTHQRSICLALGRMLPTGDPDGEALVDAQVFVDGEIILRSMTGRTLS